MKVFGYFIFILVLATASLAQSSLSGTIYDIHRSVVPGAGILITNSNGQLLRTVTTNDGRYSFSLEPGEYSAEISRVGFKRLRVAGIKIAQNVNRKLDFALEIGRCVDCRGDIYGDPWDSVAYVSGTVFDGDGNTLESVKITFTDAANHIETTRTSKEGKYKIKLPIGSLQTITFEADGYRVFKVENYQIGPTEKGSLNLDVNLAFRHCDDPTVRCSTYTSEH